MSLQYQVVALPAVWPGPKVTAKRSPFKTQWTRTLNMLEREIRHLGGSHVEIAVDTTSPRDINQNGTLRSDARIRHRIIISFRQRDGKRLAFPCGTFGFWQDNVYAVAKSLEALRMVERYGVSSTSQYEGFKALPSSTSPTLGVTAAAQILAEYSDAPPQAIECDKEEAKVAVRSAVFKTHPDRNDGDRSRYDRVDAARKALSAHHGISL